MPSTIITDELNKAGEDGWECFAINFTDVGTQCFLKRSKITDSPFTHLRQVNNKPLASDGWDKTTGVDKILKVE